MILELILAGLDSVREYIVLHVLTCLVPAFLLAGAMVSFISKEVIISQLGHSVSKIKSFSVASAGSFLIAACSCTVIPVASGIYYSGSSIGAAFILLWVAPAANILALVYTGSILGSQMVVTRILAALLMAFFVGWVMTLSFRREEQKRALNFPAGDSKKIIEFKNLVLILLLVFTLLAPNYLIRTGPYWQKVLVWGLGTILTFVYAFRIKSGAEIKSWLKESWWFVRIIFPLLLLGVFIVGVIGEALPKKFIQEWLGGSGLAASFFATLIGSVSYFATMTEAPFVDTLMKLGMGKGPALALLLTGPGLSLPNWLAIGRVFGFSKALVYVISIIILGTLVGWLFGNFVYS